MGAFAKIVLVGWVVALALAAEAATLPPTPAPAPAPATEFLNLTDLLELAGPFNRFLSLLESAGLMSSIQAQANDTQHGVTVFAPSDPAFAALKASVLGNLTAEQTKAVLLSHVISKFYTLQDFQNFSNPASTMATGTNGGKYNVNISAKSGAVTVATGYVTAPITSTVHVTHPVAVYTVPKVLLPEDIFGVAAPSPSPDAGEAPAAQAQAQAPAASPEAHAHAPSAPASAASLHHPIAFLFILATGALMLL